MILSPAEILGKALEPYRDHALRKLAERACVTMEEIRRAYSCAHGRSMPADVHLRLCLAIGIDPVDGHTMQPQPPRGIAAHSLAIALQQKRIERNHDNRTAARIMGISISTLSRLENAKVRSIDSMIAVCRYIGKNPFDYLNADVSRETADGNNGNKLTEQENKSAA